MKHRLITKWLVGAALAILLTIASVAVYAALTKTATETIGYAWANVTAATMVVGSALDVSASYSTVLCVETGCTEAGDFGGATFVVEVSYDTENWMELTTFASTADATAATENIDDASCTAADTTVTFHDADADDFDVINRTWLIWDSATPANSEICRTVSIALEVITLADPITHNHPDDCTCYDRAETRTIALPFSARQVRVICYNTDAETNCAFQYSVLKTTAIQ
jgi:hypothetical protein